METSYKKTRALPVARIIDGAVILATLIILFLMSRILGHFFSSTVDIFIHYGSYYLRGLLVTVSLSLFSVVIGTLLGLMLYLMAASEVRSLSLFAKAYIDIVRGTPLLTQIFLIFFGMASLVNFKGMGLSLGQFAYLSGVIGVSLNSAAYVSEIIRSGIGAIDRGQMEACASLGMSKGLAMEEVILPQAVKNILPSLANEFIAIIKETSIISTIGVTDIMYNVNLVRGASYKSIEPLIIGTLFYFALTFTLSRALKFWEVHYDKN